MRGNPHPVQAFDGNRLHSAFAGHSGTEAVSSAVAEHRRATRRFEPGSHRPHRLLLVRLAMVCGIVVGTGLMAAADEGALSDDVSALAGNIDRRIAEHWEAERVVPAPLASDAEFLRRAYLDICGTIPPVSEVRRFVDSTAADKRRTLIDKLLESPRYVTNFTNVWRDALIPEAQSDQQVRQLLPGFEAWLRERLAENTGYDAIAREIVTAPLNGRGGYRAFETEAELTPVAFYQAKQIKPENLAASTARTFLGVRLECAQCHDHPFDHWRREQFWTFAAFFSGIERQGQAGVLGGVNEMLGRRELTIPGTERVVQAVFLDGSQPDWQPHLGIRDTLADWLTTAENPYFARAAVNRIWAHFFGWGLVDPPDDFGANNPPSHPELLDEFARTFANHDFDLKFLIRAVTASRAYQLTSAITHSTQQDPRHFSNMAMKALSPEQLSDSLAEATGFPRSGLAQATFDFMADGWEAEIQEVFGNEIDPRTQRQSTILQALWMMNGQFVARSVQPEQSNTLAAIINYPLTDSAGRIEMLYLSTVSRKPRAEELSRLVEYVERSNGSHEANRALADVFWSLLNSSEFLFNH